VHLERAARRAGADIRLNTRAIELLVKEGQVVAVECDTPTHGHAATREAAMAAFAKSWPVEEF
jgi:phytoene dehydrogenase-like protein